MDKQIKETEIAIRKVDIFITKAVAWEFKNSWLVLEYLDKRLEILQNTKTKLYKLTKKHFTKWEYPQNDLISNLN
jgi:hypothetical protein